MIGGRERRVDGRGDGKEGVVMGELGVKGRGFFKESNTYDCVQMIRTG